MRRFTIALAGLLGFTSAAHAGPIEDRAAARALIAAQDWRGAASAYRAIVAADPYRGSNFYFLGEALARLGDCGAAIPAFQRSIALGVDGGRGGLRRAHVALARCAALGGDLDRALVHLSIAARRYGYGDFTQLAAEPALARLAADARFRRLAGTGSPELSRAAGWRADLNYYDDLVRRRHPNPFHSVSENAWRAAVVHLNRRIPQLDDLAIIAGFMRLAAMISDGHTTVIPPLEGSRAFHLLPIWPYRIGDDWVILAASPEHRDVVGARITAIAGRPIRDVEQRLRAMLPADNDRTIGFVGVTALQFFEIGALAAGRVTGDTLSITVEGPSGASRTVVLRPGLIDRDPTARWAPAGWPSATNATPPLWLRNPDVPFMIEIQDGGRTVYAQINQIGNGPNQTFAQFATLLGERIRGAGVERLIIDLRHNNGGSGTLNWALVREIVRTPGIDRPGGLFVITGPRTFSAAMNLASMLETRSAPIFVGEPTGSRPNFYGEDTPFVLPHSRLTGSISSAWFQGGATSDDLRPFIAPDLPAPITLAALREGRDPALEAIASYVVSSAR